MKANAVFRNYRWSLVLLGSIAMGAAIGILWPGPAKKLQPLGQLFLNMLYVTVVPLIFFSISSAVASLANMRRLAKILGAMLVVFVVTGIFSSSLMLGFAKWYRPAELGKMPAVVAVAQSAAPQTSPAEAKRESPGVLDQLVSAFTVSNFPDVLSKKNVLALILFAVLVGMAAAAAGEKGGPFVTFLVSGAEVFGKVITYVLYYAPIGMAGYFAYLVSVNGPYLLQGYLRVVVLYYPVCIAYFFIAFTFYTYLAGRGRGVRRFWSNILPPAMMAVGTCSSFATIPVNLEAADRIGTPREISETIIPIGATVHIDGSCMAAVMKIVFLFCLYNRPLEGFEAWTSIIGIAILSGAVIPGIPGGGITGEILIVAMFGFPAESLVYIKVIGDLVDPPATLVNAVGDNVAGMLVARILGGGKWMEKAAATAPAP